MARSRARFIRPPPRTKIWIGAGVGLTTLTANAVQLISVLSAGALLLRPFTILRTHMLFSFESDQDGTDERPFGTLAQIVVTETASGIGATAVPDPDPIAGNSDADWFLIQNMYHSVRDSGTPSMQAPFENQYEVDSKAMRKVGPQDDIVMMSSMNAFGAFVTTQGRRLIQLH